MNALNLSQQNIWTDLHLPHFFFPSRKFCFAVRGLCVLGFTCILQMNKGKITVLDFPITQENLCVLSPSLSTSHRFSTGNESGALSLAPMEQK